MSETLRDALREWARRTERPQPADVRDVEHGPVWLPPHVPLSDLNRRNPQ